MYKLLLVTDREDIVEAFSGIQDWGRLMFDPVVTLDNTADAIKLLDRHYTDAVGISLANQNPAPLMRHLEKKHPFLPIYHPQNQLDALRDELRFVREHLDRLHADFSDDDYHVDMAVELLRDDLMRRLLLREVGSQQELKSRLSLCRAHFAADRHCFLSELHMPSGDQYLHSRWRYGPERLVMALRANFLGRFVDNIYYGTALLDPGHLRIIACQVENQTEGDLDSLSRQVQEHIGKMVQDVKAYLDLDLHMAQFAMLKSINDLVPERA